MVATYEQRNTNVRFIPHEDVAQMKHLLKIAVPIIYSPRPPTETVIKIREETGFFFFSKPE